MSGSDVVLKHLTIARDEVRAQRDELNKTLMDLDRMIEGYGPQPTGGVDVQPETHAAPEASAPVPEQVRPSMRQAVLAYFGGDTKRLARSNAISKAVSSQYGWTGASVRSQLVKMHNDRLLRRGEHGFYGLALAPQVVLRTNGFGPVVETTGPSETERDTSPSQVEIPQGAESAPQPVALSSV
jgi:hypothetical protein